MVKLACERTVMQTGKASLHTPTVFWKIGKKAGVSAVADVQAQDAAFVAKKAQNTPTTQTAEKPQRAQKQNRFINYTQSEWDFAELERLEREQREKW